MSQPSIRSANLPDRAMNQGLSFLATVGFAACLSAKESSEELFGDGFHGELLLGVFLFHGWFWFDRHPVVAMDATDEKPVWFNRIHN